MKESFPILKKFCTFDIFFKKNFKKSHLEFSDILPGIHQHFVEYILSFLLIVRKQFSHNFLFRVKLAGYFICKTSRFLALLFPQIVFHSKPRGIQASTSTTKEQFNQFFLTQISESNLIGFLPYDDWCMVQMFLQYILLSKRGTKKTFI